MQQLRVESEGGADVRRSGAPEGVWDALNRMQLELGELRGMLRAQVLALKQVEDAAADFFERGDRIRKAAQRDRKVIERIAGENRCVDCQQDFGGQGDEASGQGGLGDAGGGSDRVHSGHLDAVRVGACGEPI